MDSNCALNLSLDQQAQIWSQNRTINHSVYINKTPIKPNDVVIQVSMITTFIHNNPNWQFQTRWLENLKLVKFIEEKTENDWVKDQTCASVRWKHSKHILEVKSSALWVQTAKKWNKLIKSLELDLNISDESNCYVWEVNIINYLLIQQQKVCGDLIMISGRKWEGPRHGVKESSL